MTGYKLPSLTMVVCGVFVAYVGHSVYTIAQLFMPPGCPEPSKCLHPLIQEHPKLQLLLYTSGRQHPEYSASMKLLHRVEEFDYNLEQDFHLNVKLPQKTRKNGTLFLHSFITSRSLDPEDMHSLVNEDLTVYAMAELTQYHVPEAQTINLLKDENVVKSSSNPVSHFRSQIRLHVLTEPVVLPRGGVPYDIGRSLRLEKRGRYLPILYVDRLSMRLHDLVEIQKDNATASLKLHYSSISYGKLRLWLQFEASFTPMLHLGFTEKDIDEVKGIFTDTNLYFLCVTFLVAALHMLFDILAFKNDISFWRARKNMEGISSSAVAWRAFSQIIIFLYLMEENTSYLVLVPTGFGAIIEFWKVSKAFHVSVGRRGLRLVPHRTQGESTTEKLDSEGIRYLSYLMAPLLVGLAVYSLLYTPHKSWYSWVITSLVNGVYAFGFLFMLPQLFINYRLKSVAHLPWRAFMYKAFNTFIDDLFAFIITMPTAHRVACFRDDLVFVIYLVQRWLYPVDKTRVNEFGESGEDSEDKKDK